MPPRKSSDAKGKNLKPNTGEDNTLSEMRFWIGGFAP